MYPLFVMAYIPGQKKYFRLVRIFTELYYLCNVMEITGKGKLEKLRRKNKGNTVLSQAIDELVNDLENGECTSQKQLKKVRSDADLVHNDGFYFFNLHVHRVMILIEFEEDGEATVVWCGSHDEYQRTFKDNKSTIKKWLTQQGLIS